MKRLRWLLVAIVLAGVGLMALVFLGWRRRRALKA